MKKLNRKKIIWIVREVERRRTGVYTIAGVQNITPRHARRVAKRYKNDKNPSLKKCGRKARPISNEERKIVVDTYKEYLVGATMIEILLNEKGYVVCLTSEPVLAGLFWGSPRNFRKISDEEAANIQVLLEACHSQGEGLHIDELVQFKAPRK